MLDIGVFGQQQIAFRIEVSTRWCGGGLCQLVEGGVGLFPVEGGIPRSGGWVMNQMCGYTANAGVPVSRSLIQTAVGILEVASFGQGKGDALILMSHGLGTWSSLAEIAIELVGRTPNLRVVAWSRPGCGRSERCEEAMPDPLLYEAAVVLPALMTAMQIRSTHFLAHADGATVALMFAGLFPERALSISALAPYGFADARLRAALSALPVLEMDHELSRDLCAGHAEPQVVYRGWRLQRMAECDRTWSALPHFAKISAPLLIVQGLMDDFGSLDQATAIAGSIQGLADWVTLRHNGHFLHREVPGQIVHLALGHLRKSAILVSSRETGDRPSAVRQPTRKRSISLESFPMAQSRVKEVAISLGEAV